MSKNKLEWNFRHIILIIGLFILLFSYVWGWNNNSESFWFKFTEYFAIVMVYGMLLSKLNPVREVKNVKK